MYQYSTLLKYLVLTLSLLGLLGACRQANPPTNTPPTTKPKADNYLVSSKGATLTLASGEVLVFEAGFFTEDVTVSLSSRDWPNYPANVQNNYPDDAVEPLGKTLELSFNPATLAKIKAEKRLHILPDLSHTNPYDDQELTAQVMLSSGDTSHFYETSLQPESDVEGGVTLKGYQLKSLGQKAPASVMIRGVRPLPAFTTASLPPGFLIENIVGGFNIGVGFDFAPDGRIFIAEKAGTVRVFQNGQLLPQRFVDISSQVNSRGDRGMLGIAVDPDFPQKPYVYLLFTYDPPEAFNNTSNDFAKPDGNGARVSRLIRLTADAAEGYNVALPNSEVVLVGKNSTWTNSGNPFARNDYSQAACGKTGAYNQDCIAADEQSHTIGTVTFGKDGSLFVGSGDGCDYTQAEASCLRALDPASLNGKILRIDPATGQGLSDNPFFDGNPNSNASKVYNLGLRNPFRFAIDPASGEPIIGDVGYGTWEEVNKGRGANFGWPCYEGGNAQSLIQGEYAGLSACQDFYASGKPVSPSLYAYLHAGTGSSIILGDIYQGSSYPSQYHNALFISDFNKQFLKALSFDANNQLAAVYDFGSEAGTVYIKVGPDTNLYLMNLYEGIVKRIRYVANGNQSPIALAEANPNAGQAPLSVSFSNNSYDPDGEPLSYSWTFGDGTSSTEASPIHTFTTNGVYTVTLKVDDPSGLSSSAQLSISVGNSLPVPQINTPVLGFHYNVGDTLSFSGSATDTEDGTLAANRLSWSLILHHNEHKHLDGLPPTTGASGSFVVPDHGDNTTLELCLKATDSQGASQSTCRDLTPNTVSYTFNTVPTGLQLSWEGVTRATPFTVNTIVGSSHLLTALSEQGSYRFQSWSDGGTRVHSVKVTNAARSFIANYTTSVTCGPLEQEAETAGLFGAFRIGTDALASGSSYVHVPVGFGNRYTFLADDRIEFCVNVLTAGEYRIKAWVYAENSAKDSFFVRVDDAPLDPYVWYVRQNLSYLEDYVANQVAGVDPLTVYLTAGNHKLSFYLREQDSRLDKIRLEPKPVNQAPKLRAVSNRNNRVGDIVDLQILADDPENANLSYTAASLPPGLTMSAAGRIQGKLSSSSVGSFTVIVSASDGQLNDSASFKWDVLSLSNACQSLEQEAETAARFGTFVIGADALASGGSYVYAPTGSGVYLSQPNTDQRVDFCLKVSQAGKYRLAAWVYASSGGDDSFFARLDGVPVTAYLWDLNRNTSYAKDYLRNRGSSAPLEFDLNTGNHTLSIYLREENARLDKVALEPLNPSPTTCQGLSQEAEAGIFTGAFSVASDAAASGGKYITTPVGTGFVFQGAGSDKASFCVSVSQAGQYRIKAWVYGADAGQDSFYVTMDGLPLAGYLWDILRNTSYAPDYVRNRGSQNPVLVDLSAGNHSLSFHLREDGARLDKFALERVGP